jgi:hypothetical protein
MGAASWKPVEALKVSDVVANGEVTEHKGEPEKLFHREATEANSSFAKLTLPSQSHQLLCK